MLRDILGNVSDDHCSLRTVLVLIQVAFVVTLHGETREHYDSGRAGYTHTLMESIVLLCTCTFFLRTYNKRYGTRYCFTGRASTFVCTNESSVRGVLVLPRGRAGNDYCVCLVSRN